MVLHKSANEPDKFHIHIPIFPTKMVKERYCRKEDSWTYVFTNNDLLQMAGTEDIVSFVGRQRASFVKKVIRLDNSSMQKRLMFNDDIAKKRGPKMDLLSSVLNSNDHTADHSLYMNAWQ